MSGSGQWRNAFWALVIFFSLDASAAGVILVRSQLTGGAAQANNEAIEGFRQTCTVPIREADNRRDLTRSLASDRPEVIVASGLKAAELAKSVSGNVPVLVMMVPDLSVLGPVGQTLGGVAMEVPGHVQLTYMKRLLPTLKVLGVIHSRGTSDLVQQALREAKQQGVQLLAAPAESADEVRSAVALIGSRQVIDALWFVLDVGAMRNLDIRTLTRETTERGLPCLMPIESSLEYGVLAAPVPIYTEIGRQCGELARAVAQNATTVREIGLQAPRSVLLVKRSTASQLGVPLPRTPDPSLRIVE